MYSFVSIGIDWIIFISSCIPIFIMIFLNNMDEFSLNSFKHTFELNMIFWISLLIISIISFFVLCLWIRSIKNTKKVRKNTTTVTNVRPIDADIINYFVTFIIPILSLNPSSFPSIVMNFMLLFIEGLYLVSNNTVYYNVLFIMFGYHIYNFQKNNILITKKNIDFFNFEDVNAYQISTTNIYYI
ncbi:hypothetical protein M8332_02235 [Fructilactobacillus ixorae]|uniref:Uncharacterized protein n=1 Tax=Fructilactobacillus ixorae TaxID=1750535 RepID=A0ABY5C8R0_9LACO|nr:hypothetical protein [Fructilactobacillus ixorae]USS93691.1 hypothetical protein M8332_02235 [Fructilactobacillus ixorae]